MINQIFINDVLPVHIVEDGISFDTTNVIISKVTEFRTRDLRKHYLNSVTVFPKLVYRSYWLEDVFDLFSEAGLKLKFTVVYPDIVGIEYSKTKTIKSCGSARIIECVQGTGILIKQPDTSSIHDTVVPHLINMNVGKKVVVPEGWCYTLVNAGMEPFATLEVMKREQPVNEILRGKRGAPLYIIERNGTPEIVKNSQYKNVHKYVTLEPDEYLKKLNIQPSVSVAKQVQQNASQLNWFTEPDNNNWEDIFADSIVGTPFNFSD